MQAIIDNAIEHINKGAEWVLNNARVEPKKSYKALVKQRRTLKKIRNVLEDKPAVVLYGQSQCGKSHLASSLLSDDGKPMLVIDRMNNTTHEFLTRLNPQGSGEATGLITRFTTRQQKNITKEFPVHIKLMSIKDIALLICDGYYRDLTYRNPFDRNEVENLIAELKRSRTSQRQGFISEDEFADIEHYFNNNLSNDLFTNLSENTTNYFSEISFLIEYLSNDDVIRALCMLWNNDTNLSEVFKCLFETCRRLEFATDAYISFDDLYNQNTSLLDITWLNLTDFSTKSTVRYKTQNNEFNTIDIEKTYLAAICSEVILEVNPPEANSSTKANYLRKIMEYIDILDFPGARSREGIISSGGHTGELLRRGKVGYYFNKYSEERSISSLLFCWEPDPFEAKPMEKALRNWIDIAIGKTVEERTEYMREMSVPPLFFVGTKFNMHLESKTNDFEGNDNALKTRWDKWFYDQLSTDIIAVPKGDTYNDNYKWFVSWTKNETNFNNCYLLRDFRYSTGIFDGWTEETGIELSRKPGKYAGFYEKLKESFLNHPFVKQHFKDAESRWDEASEANCDGSLPIARNLASIAEKLASAAMGKNLRDVRAALEDVITELRKHHYDPKAEENLKKALDSAARLQSALDIAFGKDRYFYGTFMKTLTISEQKVHNVFSDAFTTIGKADTLGAYVFIYMRAPDISPYNKFDDNLRILCSAYQFANTDDCRHHFEKTLHIDLNDLFKKKDIGMKSPSQMLSSALKKFLFNEWIGKEQKDKLIETLGEGCFLELKDMLISLYDKYDVEQTIASRIHNYVDKFGNNIQVISEMIADMCAEMINKFLLSVGYDYYNEKDGVMDNFKEEVASKPGIHIDFQFLDTKPRTITKEDMATLLSEMDERESIQQMLWQPDQHTTELSNLIPGFRQGCRWRDLAKIGYVLTNDIPHYDVEANEQLGQIIKQCDSIKGNVEVKLNN